MSAFDPLQTFGWFPVLILAAVGRAIPTSRFNPYLSGMTTWASIRNDRAKGGLAFWLLLLSVFTHALVPAGSPLQRSSGSAFSATTFEVAIAPARAQLAGKADQLRSVDGDGSTDGAASGTPGVAAPAGEMLASRLRSGSAVGWTFASGPAFDAAASPYAPRAPPTA